MPRTTIADVAQAAGVSVSTVSRALRGLDRVSPETRERIEQVVDFGHVVPFHTNACAPCARITTPYVERFSLIFLRWLCCVV